MKKHIIFIVAVLLVGVLFFLGAKDKEDLRGFLKNNGISLEGAVDFSLEEINSEGVVAKKDKKTLRVKVIKDMSGEKAKEYSAGQFSLVEAQYEPQPVPYPEFITNNKACDEKYKPIKNEHKFGAYQVLFAGERFSYGACTDDLNIYRASVGYFYCEKKNNLYKLEYFIPKEQDLEELTSLTRSFQCL